MPNEVFISYSRRDSDQALELAERLGAAGLSVWIDRHGIGGATQWATEIANAIRECNSLVLLITEHSVISENVQKEVALAAARKKLILPVLLRRAPMPVNLEYHLAGIHRLPYSDFDSILGVLTGVAVGGRIPSLLDGRKPILVLPFEDLSPEQDNGWFADGLTSELISVLSKIKSLRVVDWKTAKDFKGARGHTRDIARDLDVRYFLEGNVRKFGEQIKISIELLDIENGEYLWHDSHKGVFADIFSIQESVAHKVAEGLKLTLTLEEKMRVAERGTTNAEAYELFLKGMQCYFLWTRDRMLMAVTLATRAAELDPGFYEALHLHGMALLNLYRLWDRNPDHLQKAESLLMQGRRINPNLRLGHELVILYLLQHRWNDAEQIALMGVAQSPEDFYTHFTLGFFYYNTNRMEEAAKAYEASVAIRPDYRMTYWNLCEVLDRSGKLEECARWAERALPIFQKWTVLHPEDQFAQVQYSFTLLLAGQTEAARLVMRPIIESNNVDGLSLYTIATIYLHLKEDSIAAQMLGRAIDNGFADIELLKNDPHFLRVSQRPEFQKLLERLS